MAGGAEIVADLRQVGMVLARGEVDIVMAGPARCAARMRQPPIALRGSRIVCSHAAWRRRSTLRRGARLVAHLAVLRLRGEDHGREIRNRVAEADEPIRRPSLYAGQRRAHMDL